MILITNFTYKYWDLLPGDTFNLTVKEFDGSIVTRLSEEITEKTYIDFIASFRFITEDYKSIGFHLSGIFGQLNNLPQEFIPLRFYERPSYYTEHKLEAHGVPFVILTDEQRNKLNDSLLTRVIK